MHRSLLHAVMALVLLLGLLFGWRECARSPERAAAPCFYFWKTQMDFDSLEWAHLTRLSGPQPLYLRLFDVDYSAGYDNAVPLGELERLGNTQISDGRPIIPTVYVTNRVFGRLSEAQVNALAEKIHRRILRRLERGKFEMGWHLLPSRFKTAGVGIDEKLRDSLGNDWLLRCNEIQIDCDWTASTRDRYFQFLRAFHNLAAPRKLSCTVRLHQYRDRKSTGVPPVDRGMLMCYNVADPKQASTPNAIFDPRLVKGYLKAPRYPLPLDVALPIFSWGAWFRGDEFQGLLAGWSGPGADTTGLYRAEGEDRYRVLRDTVIGRDYFREGDLVRLDRVRETDLPEIAALLREHVRSHDSRLVFFDWQTDKIDRYEKVVAACAARFR